MLIDAVRSRLVYKSLDAAMTASLRPRRQLAANLRSIVNPRSSNYDRVAALVNAVDGVLPGAARRTTELICRPIQPPFPAQRVELLAFGSGATVFRAQTAAGDKVIKFYRRSLGVGADRLPEIVQMFREKYETVSSWYEQTPGLVWPADFGSLDGPILGRPAAVCIQSFISGEMRDFFRAFSEDELAGILSASPELRADFLSFARQTREICESQRRCADFLGENNLTLVLSGERPRLHLIDYGIFDLEAPDARSRGARTRLEQCLARIQSLARRLPAPQPPAQI